MKKTFFNHHIVVASFLLTTASCKKLIEIPPNPPTAIAESQQFADSASAMAAVVYVYSYTFQSTSGFGYADAMLAESTGLSSDELISTNSYTPDIPAFYSYGLT